MSDVRERLTANAQRLYDDATLLHSQERYPSAVALAILSIEEVGKLRIYSWKQVAPAWSPERRPTPTHSDKQAAFAAPFRAAIERGAMIEACKHFAGATDWGKAQGEDDWKKMQDFLVEGWSMAQHGPTSKMRERALEILNAVSAFVDCSVQSHPLACLMKLADSKDIDKEKQAAFYLDIASDGTIKSDPAKIDANASDFWLRLAEIAVKSLISYEDYEKAAERFVRDYRVLPLRPKTKKSPSIDDWKELFDRLKQGRASSHRQKRR